MTKRKKIVEIVLSTVVISLGAGLTWVALIILP